MKRIWCLLIAVLMTFALYAENRIYFFRAQDLPSDVRTVDLRPEKGLAHLTLNNIYSDTQARYALFTKRADSWWQVMVETNKGQKLDLSAVDESWVLKLKIRRTVNYTLTLVLAGAGTANGYPLPVSKVPANGEWVELSIPLSQFPVIPAFSDDYSGRLLQIHSDLGYAGDLVGIDYCYLTDDAAGVDPGTVQPAKRYYAITNSRTPLSGTPYTVVDYSSRMDVRAQGWMQWSYIPFPYFSMDTDMPVAQQILRTADCPMEDVNDDWYLIAQIRTDIEGDFVVRLFMPNDTLAYTDTLRAEDLVRDGTTWNRLCLPLYRMTPGVYHDPTDVLCSFSSLSDASAGEWTMPSLMLTNESSASDPIPVIPGDPAQETRIYLLNDGSPLPTNMNCTDYRLDQTAYLTASYGNNTTRKTSDSFLTLLPTNGWWSADIAAQTPVDLTNVDDSWIMHTRIRTTSAYRPINLILYKENNAQLARYQLTEALLPVAQNGTWFEYDIPMSSFLAAGTTLINYSGRIFSFHSDNGGTAGVEVSMEYLYFSHEGESRPDPQPGLEPVVEPVIEPMPLPEPSTEGWMNEEINNRPRAEKFFHNGQLFIRFGDTVYDVLGRKR